MAGSGSPFDDVTGPSPETLSAVLDLLGVTRPQLRRSHGHFLKAAVASFEMARTYRGAYGSDHRALESLRELHRALDAAEQAMESLRPDLKVMIRNLEDPPYSSEDWASLVAGLQKLTGVTAKAETATLPARRPDKELDRVIAHLMLRMKDATGKLAQARPADSRYDRPARLASPEAEAIWMLLKHIDEVTENTVANRIVRLGRRHGDRLEEAYPENVFIGGRMRLLTADD